MKKISRSGFLKLAAAAAMSGVTAGALTACGNSASSSSAAASSAAVYTPGTYTAKATGMGEVTVSMTFTENAITDVTVDTANETIDLARNSAEDFQKALMEAQSAEIDGVSGATYTSGARAGGSASCIQQAMGVVVEAPAEAPAAAEVKSGFPACEENLAVPQLPVRARSLLWQTPSRTARSKRPSMWMYWSVVRGLPVWLPPLPARSRA